MPLVVLAGGSVGGSLGGTGLLPFISILILVEVVSDTIGLWQAAKLILGERSNTTHYVSF